MSNLQPFADVVARVAMETMNKKDFDSTTLDMALGMKRAGDTFVMDTPGGRFKMSKLAMTQFVGNRLGGVPAILNDVRMSEKTLQSYMADLASENKEPVVVRANGDVIDAVVSEQYGFYDNQRLVYLLSSLRGKELPEDLMVKGFRVSPGAREVSMRIVSPSRWDFKNGDTYYGGIAFSNSELGNGSLTITPAIARVSCFNTVLSKNVFDLTHRFSNVLEVDKMVISQVSKMRDYSGEMFKQIQASKNVSFPNPVTVFESVAREMKLPNYVTDRTREYWQQEGSGSRLFDVIQAFTYGTQDLTREDDKRVQRWTLRDQIEEKLYTFSEDIMARHQAGQDIGAMFANQELVRKSKVLEVLRVEHEPTKAAELVLALDAESWVN